MRESLMHMSPKYDVHVFVCLNERADGRKSCGENHGLALVQAMKAALKERQLPHTLRINKAGCLDACAYGPAMVIYPEGVWYGGVQQEDLPEIIESHLINRQPVERLRINFQLPARKWLKAVEQQRPVS